jgi:putative tryptophan/tyrosine transport system substrate-binding protein
MKRRDFIKLVGGACAIPAFSVARSQEVGRTPRIGILADDRILADSRGGPNWPAFFEELTAGGFIEGTNTADREPFNCCPTSRSRAQLLQGASLSEGAPLLEPPQA